MRSFDEPNLSGDWICPICGTNEVKPVTLIGIDGKESGNNIEAAQVHMDCIELTLYADPFSDRKVIAMFFKEVENESKNDTD